MTQIPEVLFKISIEYLLNDRQVWRAYKRAKVESVGQFLLSKAVAYPGLKKAVAAAAKQFVEIWEVLTQAVDLDECDPAGICVALYQYRKKADLGVADQDVDLRKNPRHHDLLMAASLSKMASLLGPADSELPGLSADLQIDSFSRGMQNLIFNVARSIHPIEAWKSDVWTKFTPTRVLNARIHDQFFKGTLNGLIHNVAYNQGWESIGDFTRVDPKRRFRIQNFGSLSLNALLMRIVELVATQPDSPLMDNFRNRPFLQMFEDELSDNVHIKERWGKTIRL